MFSGPFPLGENSVFALTGDIRCLETACWSHSDSESELTETYRFRLAKIRFLDLERHFFNLFLFIIACYSHSDKESEFGDSDHFCLLKIRFIDSVRGIEISPLKIDEYNWYLMGRQLNTRTAGNEIDMTLLLCLRSLESENIMT